MAESTIGRLDMRQGFDAQLRWAEERVDELVSEVRERLAAGWRIDLCMAATERGTQCCRAPYYLEEVFHGLVGFCRQHCELSTMRAPRNRRAEIDREDERTRREAEQRRVDEKDRARRAEERQRTGVYVVFSPLMARAKIGVTSRWSSRRANLRSGVSGALETLLWHPEPDGCLLERYLHERMADVRIGRTEWFECPDTDAFAARVHEAIREWSEEYAEVEE